MKIKQLSTMLNIPEERIRISFDEITIDKLFKTCKKKYKNYIQS